MGGKVTDWYLHPNHHREAGEETRKDSGDQELEGWLAAGEKSGLPGKFKAWIDQHGILPRTLWPLLVYDFTLSTVGEGV